VSKGIGLNFPIMGCAPTWRGTIVTLVVGGKITNSQNIGTNKSLGYSRGTRSGNELGRKRRWQRPRIIQKEQESGATETTKGVGTESHKQHPSGKKDKKKRAKKTSVKKKQRLVPNFWFNTDNNSEKNKKRTRGKISLERNGALQGERGS